MSETCRSHLWEKIIYKLFASSWYIFLTYIYDARSHIYMMHGHTYIKLFLFVVPDICNLTLLFSHCFFLFLFFFLSSFLYFLLFFFCLSFHFRFHSFFSYVFFNLFLFLLIITCPFFRLLHFVSASFLLHIKRSLFTRPHVNKFYMGFYEARKTYKILRT